MAFIKVVLVELSGRRPDLISKANARRGTEGNEYRQFMELCCKKKRNGAVLSGGRSGEGRFLYINVIVC